jgi:hypothetical protein
MTLAALRRLCSLAPSTTFDGHEHKRSATHSEHRASTNGMPLSFFRDRVRVVVAFFGNAIGRCNPGSNELRRVIKTRAIILEPAISAMTCFKVATLDPATWWVRPLVMLAARIAFSF